MSIPLAAARSPAPVAAARSARGRARRHDHRCARPDLDRALGRRQVTCHEPSSGRELARIDFPTSNITNVAFGGPRLDRLFVTSARIGLSEQQLAEQPLAGGLFEVATDAEGVPAARFGR
jgi:hypothetical protein